MFKNSKTLESKVSNSSAILGNFEFSLSLSFSLGGRWWVSEVMVVTTHPYLAGNASVSPLSPSFFFRQSLSLEFEHLLRRPAMVVGGDSGDHGGRRHTPV